MKRKEQPDYPECLKGLGDRLRLARQEARMTQNELCEQIGGSYYQVVGHWERGKSIPAPEFMVRICKVLNISADYLLGLSDKKKSAQNGGTFKGADEKTSYRNHI